MSTPAEIIVRRAEEADLEELVALNYSVWHSTYDDLYPLEFCSAQTPESMREAWQANLADRNPALAWFVALQGGKPVGYAGASVVPDVPTGQDAELYSIYVKPAVQGLGVGTKLLGAACRFLKDQQAKSLLVWIPSDNPFARFYPKTGAKKLEQGLELEFAGQKVPMAAYAWDSLDRLTAL